MMSHPPSRTIGRDELHALAAARRAACAPGDIDVFHFRLDGSAPDAARAGSMLAVAELERAAAFRYPHLRARYMHGRATMRAVLAAFRNEPAGTLSITEEQHGKPTIGGVPAFNLAHADDHAVLGVGYCPRIGVDIERVESVGDDPALAERILAPAEFERWIALPAERRASALARAWTRKESFIKATGEGLARDLHSFEVSVDELPPQLRTPLGFAADRWTLFDLPTPHSDYAAALAADVAPLRLHLWRLSL